MSNRMTNDQVAELIMSMLAIYDEARADGVMNTLLALTERLPSNRTRRWTQVFRELGRVHPGLHRFGILLGIYEALAFVDAAEWLGVWLKALPAAGIHPISMMLCARPDEDPYKQQLEDLLYAMNSKHKWVDGWYEYQDRRHRCSPHWILELSAGKMVNNVLSSGNLQVTDASGHDQLLVGDGWCVHSLDCMSNGHWYGCRIGLNLTVLGILNLGNCVGPTSVGRGLRVGGYFLPQRNLRSFEEMPMTEDPPPELGVRIRGEDFHIEYMGGDPSRSPLKSPIEIPDSYIRLARHLSECDWMQPEPM